MKKYLFLVAATFMVTSCKITTKTARTESVPYSMYNATVADLEPSASRITYTMTPSKQVRRAGLANCKQAAINEALIANGNEDLLLEPQFVITRKKFTGKVKSVTVSGRPARYTNFRSLNDSVWVNPVFRHASPMSAKPNILKKILKRH